MANSSFFLDTTSIVTCFFYPRSKAIILSTCLYNCSEIYRYHFWEEQFFPGDCVLVKRLDAHSKSRYVNSYNVLCTVGYVTGIIRSGYGNRVIVTLTRIWGTGRGGDCRLILPWLRIVGQVDCLAVDYGTYWLYCHVLVLLSVFAWQWVTIGTMWYRVFPYIRYEVWLYRLADTLPDNACWNPTVCL